MRKVSCFIYFILIIVLVLVFSGCNIEESTLNKGSSLDSNDSRVLEDNNSDSKIILKGEYVKLSSFGKYLNDNSKLKLIGESGNSIFVLYSPNNYDNTEIFIYDLTEQRISESLDLETSYEGTYRVKYDSNNIIVTKSDGIYYYSKDLKIIRKVAVPELLQKKILQGMTGDEKGNFKTFFSGFDISNDQNFLVYADIEGVKLYNLLTGQERSIIKSNSVYFYPYFIGENNIVATKGGYEGFSGFIYYSFKDNDLKTYNFKSDVIYFKDIYMGHMIAMPAVYYDDGKGSIMFDINNGEYYDMGDEANWHIGYMVPDTYSYSGEHCAALVEFSNENRQEKTIHKYYYELNKLGDEELEIRNARVEIIGVLRNNSVLIKYYNDTEVGVALME